MRVVVALATVLAVVVGGAAPAAAQGDLDAAREEANAAAAELADSQTRLAEVEGEIDEAEAAAKENGAKVAELEALVRDQAVAQFLKGEGSRLSLVLEGDLSSVAKADALARYVTLGAEDAVDAYQAARADLEASEKELAAAREDLDAAVEEMAGRADAANAELGRLEQLEAERMAREEAQRREAEARDRSAAPASGPAPEAGQAASGGGGGGARVLGGGGWVCPVQGPRAFSNDWGQPRSGGRRHQGNDILAPRGTPVVASVGGSVRTGGSSLGGTSYYLTGEDGNTYYGTHLDSLSGASGRVAAGTVLGTVGNSGNARGGPTHLHFEIHPGGGGPVNPYPTLSRYC